MSERFIVTGGAGFIGSNLVRALNARGHADVIVVDHLNHPQKRENLKYLRYADFFDKSEFREMLHANRVAPVNGIFHLGACSSTTETDERYLDDNNFRYTQEICQWSLQTGARFVYASSASTYGDGSKGYSDDDESTRGLEPLNLYGKSKQKFDLWALQSGALREIAGLKYFNVFGPGEDHKGEMRSLVNKAYQQIVSDGKIRLFKSHRSDYHDGKQMRDFITVEDAVAVTLFFYDHRQISGIFNCGTGQARTWLDLARALFAAMERAEAIEFIDMPENLRDKYQYYTQADMSKLRDVGYKTEFQSIESGVRRYVIDYLSLQDV